MRDHVCRTLNKQRAFRHVWQTGLRRAAARVLLREPTLIPADPVPCDNVTTSTREAHRSEEIRASILAVTSEIPWPLDSGGHLRTYHVLRLLAAHFRVRLIFPSRSDDAVDGCTALERAGIEARAVAVGRRNPVGEAIRLSRAAIANEPYVMFARHHYQAVRRRLQEELTKSRPDVLYLDHLDSFAYAREASDLPVVGDMHNVYSRLALRLAQGERRWIPRAYLSHEANLIARMERSAARLAHTMLAVSDNEAQYFSTLGATRVTTVVNGVDCGAYAMLPVGQRTGPPTILYVGSFNWPPNAAAARFLAAEVLPVVARALPEARVLLVGKDPGPELRRLAQASDRIEIAAHVTDVMPYLRRAHLLAVPLETGGGTRLKILEAFAAGLPVVSTPVGCEGISAVNGEHLVVSERAGFAAATLQSLLGRGVATRLAESARCLARERYDWAVVGASAVGAVAAAAASGSDAARGNGATIQRRLRAS